MQKHMKRLVRGTSPTERCVSRPLRCLCWVESVLARETVPGLLYLEEVSRVKVEVNPGSVTGTPQWMGVDACSD